MDIEQSIRQIVDDGNVDKMYELTELFEDAIDDMESFSEKCAKKYKMKLYILANGKVLNKELAEGIVKKMKPSGMRWTFEETRDIQDRYNLNHINPADFFVVMNSAFNDYRTLLGDNIDSYVQFTTDFIEDEDAVEGKVFTYFTTIPR